MAENDYRQYLDPQFIARFSNLEITTSMILQGFMLGLHSSPLHGFSAEFAEHKQYVSGDSLRHLDWKVYGRTEKMYLKRFEDETNLYANIFLDKSSSMSYKSADSVYSKLDYGRQLAAALTQLFLNQKDAVGYGTYASKLYKYIEPHSYRQQQKIILTELAGSDLYTESATAGAYTDISYRVRKAGITVIISDLLEEPSGLLPALLLLKKQRQDVMVFMVADECEYKLEFQGRLQLIDLENRDKMEIPAAEIRRDYVTRYNDLIKTYDAGLTEKGIWFKFITTATPFDVPLREILLARMRNKY